MSQASSATLSGTHLPTPPNPLFQNFQFKVIGKEPALLMRLSNNMGTQLDDLDMDDIYEELPLPSSSSVATEIVPRRTCSRPTLFQALAGDDELGVTDPNDPPASMDVVNSSSFPASLQSIPSFGGSDVPKILPNTASPLPISPSGAHRLWTSSVSPGPAPQKTACAAGPSINSQHSDRSDRDSKTHTSPHPSPDDLVLSDQDLRPVDRSKALKKVVLLKDKFRAVSATARQSQRLAKHALINAQRSAAAAQTCLAAAESFVPCVGDVISAIRRIRPGNGACGPTSEWTAVLRDLEDDLYDLKQWSSFDTFGRDALGQNLPLLRTAHLAAFGGMSRESCNGFPLSSVEEEAQEALKAWNQLDRQTHVTNCPAGCGRPRLELGSQGDVRVSPQPHINRGQLLGLEDEVEKFQHQEISKSKIRVSKEIAETSRGNLDNVGHEQEIFQAGRWQTVEAEGVMQPREEVVPLKIATGAADAKDGHERQGPRGDQMQDQQHPAQSCERSHHSPGSRGEEAVPDMAANSDIQSFAPKKILADCLQPVSASPRRDISIGHIQATSKSHAAAPSGLQDRDPRNLQAAFATPIAEGDPEHTPAPTSNPVSSNDMPAEKQPAPPSLSASPNEVSVAPRMRVDPTDSTTAGQAHPSTPIPTINSGVVSGDGELSKTVVLRSEITLGSPTSDRLRAVSCRSPIKTEPVEPQLNFGVEENRAVGDPLVSNGVKPPCNIPLKLDSETPAVSVPLDSPDECEMPSGRVLSVDLPASLPNGLPAMKQKLPETNIVISDSVTVIATRLTSPHNVANNGTPAQSGLSNSSASPSDQLAPTSRLASVPAHSPISPSAVPLALRVERPTSYNHIRDLDDSISPDLMFSRGWDADENDRSRRSSRRSPNKFEPVPRSRSRDLESRNQYVDHGSRSMAPHPRSYMSSLGSRSPDGRHPISSYEYPVPLIGKKRPRDEVNHPLPPRGRRDWTGTPFPSISENQMSHVSQVDTNANPRLGLLATPISEPSYNSNNSSRHPALINRLDPSSGPTVQAANPLERRIQHPFRPQQPPQTSNRPWQNSGYNASQPSYGRRGHQGYDNDRTPPLLSRMMSSQQFQHGHNMLDSGHSPNVGRPSNRSHGRGRSFGGQGGSFQQQHQQHFSRKPPSLYDRLDSKP